MEQNGNDILPYAAFLRGINVGGNRSIKMAELRTAFAAQGFTNVKTVLASGNVLFDTAETDAAVLCKAIEQHLKQEFGHKIFVLLRTVAELQCLVAANPFKEIAATPQMRSYITFLPDGLTGGKESTYVFPEDEFAMVRLTAREVCSAFELSPQRGTLDLMALLEREFGPTITTRTWNTVTRLLNAT